VSCRLYRHRSAARHAAIANARLLGEAGDCVGMLLLIATGVSPAALVIVSPRAAHTAAIADNRPLDDALRLLEHAWVGLTCERPAVFRVLGEAR